MTPTAIALCALVGQLAESVMLNRQAGLPMSTQLTTIVTPESPALIQNIIVLAYEQPRFHTPANQRRAVEDFRNDTEAACLRATN